MDNVPPSLGNAALNLATESIVVKTRWFGIIAGVLLVESRSGLNDPVMLRCFLGLGAFYTALDTVFHWRGRVFLEKRPLFVSFMEALFIGLLCYYDEGLNSPFRYYYLLSLICCAFRYERQVVAMTFLFDCVSLSVLLWALRHDRGGVTSLPLLIGIMAWVTWACSALAGMLKAASRRLGQLNVDLERNQGELERRVVERSAALRASQARVIHQEKMAGFGLLAAGIAHEVGNPLAAVSSLIQMLKRRDPDSYTAEKLDLAQSQLSRIQRTIRELIDFSRPASTQETIVRVADVVDESLSIAKYYQRTKDRRIVNEIPSDLPRIRAVRDRLTQVVFNLVMNAIDATSKDGRIRLSAEATEAGLTLWIEDDGRGVSDEEMGRLFQPYYTTKPQGTGLGLFVSRQIAEELGGTLTCRSQLGEGATFILTVAPARLESVPAPLVALEAGG